MSVIYLIECKREYDTVYKIGYSRNSASKRLENCQTGNDGELKVINTFESKHGQTVERTLHRMFEHLKIQKNSKNEWFKLELSDVQNFTNYCHKIEKNLDFLKLD